MSRLSRPAPPPDEVQPSGPSPGVCDRPKRGEPLGGEAAAPPGPEWGGAHEGRQSRVQTRLGPRRGRSGVRGGAAAPLGSGAWPHEGRGLSQRGRGLNQRGGASVNGAWPHPTGRGRAQPRPQPHGPSCPSPQPRGPCWPPPGFLGWGVLVSPRAALRSPRPQSPPPRTQGLRCGDNDGRTVRSALLSLGPPPRPGGPPGTSKPSRRAAHHPGSGPRFPGLVLRSGPLPGGPRGTSSLRRSYCSTPAQPPASDLPSSQPSSRSGGKGHIPRCVPALPQPHLGRRSFVNVSIRQDLQAHVPRRWGSVQGRMGLQWALPAPLSQA